MLYIAVFIFMIIALLISLVLTNKLNQAYQNKITKRISLILVFLAWLCFIIVFFKGDVLKESEYSTLVMFIACLYIFYVYVTLIFFIVRAFYLYIKKKPIFKSELNQKTSSLVLAFCLIIGLYAYFSARDIQVKNYQIESNKIEKEHKIVFLSDLHLGSAIDEKELDKLVNLINQQKPDVIFIGGDLYDEHTSNDLETYSVQALKKLQANFGKYYIFGNHEYYTHQINKIEKLVDKADFKILAEDKVNLENNLVVFGRQDTTKYLYEGKIRPQLDMIYQKKANEFLLVLDHHPIIDDSKKIDLQLSGHTHNGQIFPLNLVYKFVFDHVYGYYKQPYEMIVSSGVGAYAYPARLFTDSEIVVIDLKTIN